MMFEYYVHFLISGALMNGSMLLLPPMNVYVHGTYRSGQWTCCPDPVVLFVGGGVGTAGRVGTAGGGGERVLSVAVTSVVTESSMCTGFRRSSNITSCLPWTLTVNVLAPRSITL